jgi:hypothetical protein
MAAIGHCQSYFAGKLEPAQAKRQAYSARIVELYGIPRTVKEKLKLPNARPSRHECGLDEWNGETKTATTKRSSAIIVR